MQVTLAELARFLADNRLPVTVDGDPQRAVSAVATLEDAGPADLSFLAKPRYERLLATTAAGAVVVSQSQPLPPGRDALRAADPYAAITACIIRIHGHRKHPGQGVHPAAQIDPSATLGPGANVHAGVTIRAGVTIGRNVVLYPGVHLGEGCRLGDDCVLFPNVVVYDGCVLRDRVTIHAGSVIGEDGLGYAPLGKKWLKIPQVGTVEIGSDVEIGACCTIDRATLGRTVIGGGTKLSNLIAIGHGTRVGTDCLLVAQVGLAGSVTVGSHVTMAGKVGVAGHLTIGDNVRIGAMAGVMRDVEPGVEILGSPGLPIKDARRVFAATHRLPEMRAELRALRAEVAELRAALDAALAAGRQPPR
ncbi:MAG: UDP-3-O-(3-hydroxymyristoyl)glucosamine N-acyltransferase [Phycisphaerae bacterium]